MPGVARAQVEVAAALVDGQPEGIADRYPECTPLPPEVRTDERIVLRTLAS
jgi:hypothetical protein